MPVSPLRELAGCSLPRLVARNLADRAMGRGKGRTAACIEWSRRQHDDVILKRKTDGQADGAHGSAGHLLLEGVPIAPQHDDERLLARHEQLSLQLTVRGMAIVRHPWSNSPQIVEVGVGDELLIQRVHLYGSAPAPDT